MTWEINLKFGAYCHTFTERGHLDGYSGQLTERDYLPLFKIWSFTLVPNYLATKKEEIFYQLLKFVFNFIF